MINEAIIAKSKKKTNQIDSILMNINIHPQLIYLNFF